MRVKDVHLCQGGAGFNGALVGGELVHVFLFFLFFLFLDGGGGSFIGLLALS